MPVRLSPSEALDHPRRRLLLAFVQANPGANFRQVARATGLAAGTARHHLTRLARCALIVERQHGGTVRFFDGASSPEGWIECVLRREPALADMHDWLKANPRAPQSQVIQAMQAHGWERSTTQYRLHRLVASGTVTIFLQGRYKLYSAARPHSPLHAPTTNEQTPGPEPGARGAGACQDASDVDLAPALLHDPQFPQPFRARVPMQAEWGWGKENQP